MNKPVVYFQITKMGPRYFLERMVDNQPYFIGAYTSDWQAQKEALNLGAIEIHRRKGKEIEVCSLTVE